MTLTLCYSLSSNLDPGTACYLALLGGTGLTRTAFFGLITYSEHALTSLSILFLFNNKEPYCHDCCVPTCFYVILGA